MRFLFALGVAGFVACADMLGPGGTLIGAWSSPTALLVGGRTAATFTTPCIAASFAPIRLDDSSRFQIIGVVTRATGLVTVRPGDPYPLAGHAIGDRLVIGTDTLKAGQGGPFVCTS